MSGRLISCSGAVAGINPLRRVRYVLDFRVDWTQTRRESQASTPCAGFATLHARPRADHRERSQASTPCAGFATRASTRASSRRCPTSQASTPCAGFATCRRARQPEPAGWSQASTPCAGFATVGASPAAPPPVVGRRHQPPAQGSLRGGATMDAILPDRRRHQPPAQGSLPSRPVNSR